MNKIVIGVFQSSAEAKQVVQELRTQGVISSEISILALGDDKAAWSGTLELKGRTLPDGSKLVVGGKLGDLLTGTGHEAALTACGVSGANATAYLQALRAGKVVVAVEASELKLAKMNDLMGRFNKIAIEQEKLGKAEVEVKLPVVQEELHVGKREVQRGGVQVVSHVTEKPVQESVRLREEHVSVQRTPVDRPVAAGDATAFKEGTFEVRQKAEEVVVNKEARVVEEVVIGKKVTEHTETVRDTVRRTDVAVENLPANGQTDHYSAHEQDFRKNHAAIAATNGIPYDEAAPAYRLGADLSASESHQGKDWPTLETEAKTHWETENSGSWDRIKHSVRYAWDKVRHAVS
jgi:uncharacterized protein (TIGR02271 family)